MLPGYGATVQVAVVLLHVVFLLPGPFGTKEPAGMLPLWHALAEKPGMDIEDTEADSHELAYALASARQALFAERMR